MYVHYEKVLALTKQNYMNDLNHFTHAHTRIHIYHKIISLTKTKNQFKRAFSTHKVNQFLMKESATTQNKKEENCGKMAIEGNERI